ncbi:hypothetical protein [Corallococcus silvisoli]|nr:hypothetical protein [Corallococcus silvisoli]
MKRAVEGSFNGSITPDGCWDAYGYTPNRESQEARRFLFEQGAE